MQFLFEFANFVFGQKYLFQLRKKIWTTGYNRIVNI